MRHFIATAIGSAALAASLLAGAQERAVADASVLAATFNSIDDADDVLLPAYVPIKNLGVFLTAAWKTMPSTASRVETGAVDGMHSVSDAAKSEARSVLLPAETATALIVTRTATAPTLAVTQAIATLRAADASAVITAVNAESDDAVIKPADVAPAQTLDSLQPQDVKKDDVQHVKPAPVSDATAVQPARVRLASLTKPRSKKSGVYRDWQVGVPGQSMEPLISMCAQAPRKCSATVEFCGC